MGQFQFETLAALLSGLVFAGALLEAIAAFSYERIGFGLLFGRGALGLLALPLLVMTGPMIVLRGSVAMLRMSPPGWAFMLLGSGVAAAWAVASGHVLLRIIGALSPAITGPALL